MSAGIRLGVSGERFSVVYRLTGDEPRARALAQQICIDQSTEFPLDLTPEGDIRDFIVGQVESLVRVDPGHWAARISFAVETAASDLLQLLNVLFSVVSFRPGICLQCVDLPDALVNCFRGPRFGRKGLRAMLNAYDRPLVATALKPSGLPPDQLAELAYRFALGGLDIIKDDHLMADHPFCPFRERVERCAAAVRQANRETGYGSLYVAAIPGPVELMRERALFAGKVGADGLLISPGLTGWDTLRRIADDDEIALPIIGHPALLGSYTVCPDTGISGYALFGQIPRLSGVDAMHFVGYGPRFPVTAKECRDAAAGCEAPMGHLVPIFASPAGGTRVEVVPELVRFYGPDVLLMIATGLHQMGRDLTANARAFRRAVEQTATPSAPHTECLDMEEHNGAVHQG